ncbi:MAG: hypothetical protein DI566_01915 [Microbacterium sp.]|nr:MAG: hypothetical protein DI566_01915 [Microbacterium sp.]
MSLFRPMVIGSTTFQPIRTRVEPEPLSGDPAVGLMAQVWDPLWMLARQWQFGEFAGEDTGTPLAVTVTAEFEPFTAWHPGALDAEGGGQGWLPLEAGALLEPLVEAEPAPERGGRLAAAAGWALEDALLALGETAAVRALKEHCARAPEPPDVDAGSDWAGVGTVLATRALDAREVAAQFTGGAPDWFTAALRTGAARRARAGQAVSDWLDWWAHEVAATAGANSWVPGALEYGFAVATPERVLEAREYGGGELGWASFDLRPDVAAPADAAGATIDIERHLLASQLSFPGMPASRFWEFEDGDLDLGAVWADPHELARVLVVEAAIVTGDDWLVLPVDAPPGGILRVTRVEWRDTFGARWTAERGPAEVAPRLRRAPWRLFTTTEPTHRDAAHPRDDGAARVEVDGLVVAPAAAAAIDGAPIEDVRFVRDETANLVWGIVQTAPGASGDPEPVTPAPPAAPKPIRAGDEPPAEVLGYELMTYVPETWRPYVAQLDPDRGVVLRRARIDDGAPARDTRGELLAEEAQRVLHAGEVPRQGVRVQRVPRVARRADGSWATWVGRRVRPGYGEGESGLQFDRARLPDAEPPGP